VISSGDHDPNRALPLPWPQAGVRQVTLKDGKTTVLVKSVLSNPDGKYVGEIYGFEPPGICGPRGMQIGESIEFGDQHVFTAGS
jgi:hypothetical protein